MGKYSGALLLIAAFVLTGCNSIITRSGEYDKYYIYPGVRASAEELSRPDSTFIELKTLVALDLPFSFVLDTVLLPVDAIVYAVSE